MKSERDSDGSDPFVRDVISGLSATEKFLPSKYFYDEQGDTIFREIMAMPEYYLTHCEFEILEDFKREIVDVIDPGKRCFDIIEMGAGDGYKTKILLRHLLERNCDVQYMPIDISKEGLDDLKNSLNRELPGLRVEGIVMDYFSALHHIKNFSCREKVFFFLGSNMGNFTYTESLDFLKLIASGCKKGDKFLVGLDLKKDPKIILDAYNDNAGITRRFNLNLLHRMNRELGADFNPERFMHYPLYDPNSGKAISYLVSLEDQVVEIPACNMEVKLNKWEAIRTEISQKYDLEMIHELAGLSGFRVCKNFFDSRHYFVNSVWEREQIVVC
jgi:dimethylhistidine N-methyltransferase